VKQEYRSLLATTASFLQTHDFSQSRSHTSSLASVGAGEEHGGMRTNVFRDEDGHNNNDDDDKDSGRDDWSFSVTVEVPSGSTDLEAEVPVSFCFFFSH
jgi:hypothetical protein